MTDRKISELVAVTSVDAADEFVLARSGSSNKITGANLTASVGGTPSFARVQHAASIPTWDGSTLPFDVVSVDADGLWDAANHQFVAQQAGWYEVSAYVAGSGYGVSEDAAANDGVAYVTAVVFGSGDNLSAGQSLHAAVLSGVWIVPPLYGHTQLGIGDAVVIQGSGGAVPSNFTFAIYGPL
jgi:hypothetical protein